MHKIELSGPYQHYTLPRQFEGCLTDVIEVGGTFRPLAGKPACQKKLRPARPGCSIGFELSSKPEPIGSAGTLGAFVRSPNGAISILSNNHVLANVNQLPLGTPVLQPGVADDGSMRGDRIGQLTQFAPIQEGSNLDCALASVDRPEDVNPIVMGPRNMSSGLPLDAAEDMHVWKYGRSSQFTEGVIFETHYAFRMNYDLVSVQKGEIVAVPFPIIFRNQIGIWGGQGYGSGSLFATDGDSGAVIIEKESDRPVGLLLGGTDTITVANHLSHVLSHLNVEVVTA